MPAESHALNAQDRQLEALIEEARRSMSKQNAGKARVNDAPRRGKIDRRT